MPPSPHLVHQAHKLYDLLLAWLQMEGLGLDGQPLWRTDYLALGHSRAAVRHRHLERTCLGIAARHGAKIDLGWMNYGSETRREPFSTTIPDVTVDVNTTNNIVQAFLVLRGRMPKGPIQLYGDAFVGLNYLYTETRISDTDDFTEDIASTTNQDDAAFAYGFGGGVMVPVFTRQANSGGGRPMQILLDGGLRYIMGGEAEYLKTGSIRREGGVVAFDTIKSKTDMLRMHLGLVIRF